jgi:hypothetical protein
MQTKTVVSPTSEAAIFARLWDQGPNKLTGPLARHILKLRFSDADQSRVVDLVRRNQTGRLTPAEIAEMDSYLKVGDLLALLQSKARQFLKRQGARRNGHG